MAISRVQSLANSNHSTTITKAATFTNGNFVVVILTAYYSGGGSMSATPTLTDGTNTYTRCVGPLRAGSSNDGNNNLAIFYCENVVGGSYTLTATPGGAGTPFNNLFIAEYSGIKSASSLDQTNSNSASLSGNILSGSVSTTQGSELLIFGFGTDQGNNPVPFTPGNSFTVVQKQEDAVTFAAGALCERIVASSGSYEGQCDCIGTSKTAAGIATFKGDVTITPLTVADTVDNLADAVSISNSAAANYGVATSDQLSLADGLSLTGPPPNYFLLLGESLANLQDSPRVAIGILQVFSDSVNNLADSFASMVGIPIQVFDSQQFSWADALATSFGAPLSLTSSDSINNYADFVDAILKNVKISVTVSDTINNLADAIRIYNVLRASFGDNLTLSDSVRMRFLHLMRIADALGISDAIRTDVSSKPAFSDSIDNLNDAVSVSLAVSLIISKGDQLNLTDAVSISLDGVYNGPGFIDRIRRYLGDIQSS
jgi:hypothetical protein